MNGRTAVFTAIGLVLGLLAGHHREIADRPKHGGRL